MKKLIKKNIDILFSDNYFSYILENNNIHYWDITSLRPDPELYFKKNIKYKGDIILNEENLYNGKIVYIPKEIIIKNLKFINIRL